LFFREEAASTLMSDLIGEANWPRVFKMIILSNRDCVGWVVLTCGLLLQGAVVLGHAGEVSDHRLCRTNLLQYHEKDGSIAPVTLDRHWRSRRAEILRGMTQVMGSLPGKEKRCPLDIRVVTETDAGAYVCRDITYASEPGSRVPAYLLIPKRALEAGVQVPAVLALHPTDMEYGRRVVIQELRPYYRMYARDLAERGFVVLAPAYPLMADYQPDLKALGYESGTMKAIWDNVRGLDLLESLPFVDKSGFGAIGHSLGGHNAIFTAAFDGRIKSIVSSCGFDSFQDYKDGDITGWTSDRYMPKLLEYRGRLEEIPFDFHEVLGLIAPRRVFVSAPLRDTNFKWTSVDEVVAAARSAYRFLGKPEALRVDHPDCEHDFPPVIRGAAYSFLIDAARADSR